MTRILIVQSRFYEKIADALLDGAIKVLEEAEVNYECLDVPGAFEIPAAIRIAAKKKKKRYDGYVALGCVIRGETAHYEYVCSESARGLMDLAVGKGLAIGYGILTVESEKQALARANIRGKNRGGKAAQACLRMVEVKEQFR